MKLKLIEINWDERLTVLKDLINLKHLYRLNPNFSVECLYLPYPLQYPYSLTIIKKENITSIIYQH